MKKNNKVKDLTLADFETNYKFKIIKLVLYCGKGQKIMKRESSEIYSNIYYQLIFHKGTKIIQWPKERLFNKWSLKNLVFLCDVAAWTGGEH